MGQFLDLGSLEKDKNCHDLSKVMHLEVWLGEIMPLWHDFKILCEIFWAFVYHLAKIWIYFGTFCHWAHFRCRKWPKNLAIWSHWLRYRCVEFKPDILLTGFASRKSARCNDLWDRPGRSEPLGWVRTRLWPSSLVWTPCSWQPWSHGCRFPDRWSVKQPGTINSKLRTS